MPASRLDRPRSRTEKTKHEGIYKYHARRCTIRGRQCKCPPNYQATAYSGHDRKLLRKHFPTATAAKAWKQDAGSAIRAGTLRAPTKTTVGEALEAYIAGMRDGTIRGRGGRGRTTTPYKPSTVRKYARDVRERLEPEFGRRKLSELHRQEIQDFVDLMDVEGAAAATIHNVLDPLRAVYRRALQRDEVTIDPTKGLVLPAVQNGRDRIADPVEAELLIDALPDGEQALWATAVYAGLRRGELRELRWSDVDLERNEVRVARSLDDGERGAPAQAVDPKSKAGSRCVPVVPDLRRRLVAHKLRTGRDGDDLVFGRSATAPFVPTTARSRALRAWGWKEARNPEPTGPRTIWIKASEDALAPLTLHEARHTCASVLIAAGVNLKALSSIMGHASVTITLDRYGHLMPDGVAEAGRLVAEYLEQARRAVAE